MHLNPSTPCPICGQQFTNLAAYQRHVPTCEARAHGDMHDRRSIDHALRLMDEEEEWFYYVKNRLQEMKGTQDHAGL